MRVVKFSIKNYRSITKAYDLPLAEKCILIGPNNEGKSNILLALVLAITSISGGRYRFGFNNPLRSLRREARIEYIWNRDFPLRLQKKYSKSATEFRIELELNDIEKKEFKKRIKINLSTNLTFLLKYYKDKREFGVLVKGRAKKNFQDKKEKVARFINDYISLQYIPSVRTATLTIDIVEDLISRILANLENDPVYQKLIKDVEKYRNSTLSDLSKYLTEGVAEFLPDVKSVKLQQSIRKALRESCNILVDDGNETELVQKGDGIKSLVAISIVSYLSKQFIKREGLLLSIEEPESHLHPLAVHKLSNVLNEIAKEHQVIITTHSPLLVDKKRISNNIIVHKSKAKPANSINEVREILGVKVSDNLSTASIVLLCEGSEDVKILTTWISYLSPKLKSALDNKILVFADMNGGTNLSYNASLYRSFTCIVTAFLDDDDCGRNAFDEAQKKGFIDFADIFFSKCPNRKNSEIEDMVDKRLYIKEIESKYGINIDPKIFDNKKIVWSDRLKSIFDNLGKPWNDSIESDLKKIVMEKVEKYPDKSLLKSCSGPIENLIKLLESKIG